MRAQLQQRLAALRESTAFRSYEETRDWVLELVDRTGDKSRPSVYWIEELETMEYLLDASPLIIDRLRHHTYTVTGIRAYDYRRGKDVARDRFAEKLQALVELAGGDELLVPEAPELGGFGHEIEGRLFNIDTLKFFEVLIGMERAGILEIFRAPVDRPVAMEIGAGWGGFAYQFKCLFPQSTYVIVDLPHLFLLSATYLSTVFPEARIHRWMQPGDEANVPPDADFVLIPHYAFPGLTLSRLDLTVNMISFQEMTGDQVDGYATRARELSSSFIYSLNRERSHYNDQLKSVTEILDCHFWIKEVPLLPVNYTKLIDSARAKKARADANDYRHLVGTPRMLV